MEVFKSTIDELIDLSPLHYLYEDGMELQVMKKDGTGFRVTDNLPNIDKDSVIAIGMTGWNAVTKKTHYVTFDIDSFSNHKSGLSEVELSDLFLKLESLDFVTIYRSTSGLGYHIYVFFEQPITAETRREHIHIARYIKNKINVLLGGDFSGKVDVSGLVSWIWHAEKMTDKSFELVKQGVRTEIEYMELIQYEEEARQLTKGRVVITLSPEHRQLMEWLNDNNKRWWWEDEKQLLITHTAHLRDAKEALNFKGDFTTVASGSDNADHNCYCIPLPNGAWKVRRFGDVKEPDWIDELYTYLNKPITLSDAIKRYNGVETPSGAFVFTRAEDAIEALALVDIVIGIPAWASIREAKLRKKNGRLILEFRSENNDPLMKEWVKEGGYWKRIIGEDKYDNEEVDLSNIDDWCRYVLNPDHSDNGWFILINGIWSRQTLTNVKHRLFSVYKKEAIIKDLIGNMIENAWQIDNTPFCDEYPGNRIWNFGSKLRFTVGEEKGATPTWDSVFTHLGSGIDTAAKEQLGISGKQYLLYWAIALLRYPNEPLPYLFFFGPQNSGKTTFHEALSLLFDRGYVKADAALTTAFNAELANAILCVIEEVNIRSKQVYNKIKDYVTGRTLLVHEKGQTPYMAKNYTHWIQVANSYEDCPIFSGDTRITAVPVNPLENHINRRSFEKGLIREAQYFLNKIYYVSLPEYDDRLLIPALKSKEKESIEERNDNAIVTFLEEWLVRDDGGNGVLFSEVYNRFIEETGSSMGKIKFGKYLPLNYVKERRGGDNQLVIKDYKFK